MKFQAEDRVLRVGVRYTGFLIVRVDPDEGLYNGDSDRRYRRQVARWLQPRYSFSDYFEPVRIGSVTATGKGGSWIGLTAAVSVLLLLLLIATAGLVYFWRSDGKRLVADRCPACLLPVDDDDGDCVEPRPPEPPPRPEYGPIPADRLVEEFCRRHANSDFLFEAEFGALPHHKSPAAASAHPDNHRKNRYNDIKAFDATRVKLRPTGLPTSDYINANFVEGYRAQRRFIAAQGPLPETVVDFWRMVWEHNVHLIIMVTNLQERYRPQCTKYWPEAETQVHGDVEVQPREVSQHTDFLIRNFTLIGPPTRPLSTVSGAHSEADEPLYDSVAGDGTLLDRQGSGRFDPSTVSLRSGDGGSPFKRSDSGRSTNPFQRAGSSRSADRSSEASSRASRRRNASNSASSPSHRLADGGASSPLLPSEASAALGTTRLVQQWHYTGWHDYKAPECTVGLLRFLLRLRQSPLFNAHFPVLVHCSAGVGRTGTIISIDGLISQLAEERRADVFGLVSSLRPQRNFMVQSQEQYVFIYKALAEWLSFGDTDVPAEQLPAVLAKMRTSGELRAEFEKLSRSLERPSSQEFARKAEHREKNRDGSSLPFDRNRIVLQPVVGHLDATYVNATLLRGGVDGLIVAQEPLQRTRLDLWRMVSENDVGGILQLSQGQRGSNQPEERYWPEGVGDRLRLGGEGEPTAVVRLVMEERLSPNLVRRRLAFSVGRDASSAGPEREALVWELVDWWRESPTPESTGPLLDLLVRLWEAGQRAEAGGSKLLLHCRDGATRAGLVSALLLLLERLRLERRVDVFQTVKALQAQREAVLPNFVSFSPRPDGHHSPQND